MIHPYRLFSLRKTKRFTTWCLKCLGFFFSVCGIRLSLESLAVHTHIPNENETQKKVIGQSKRTCDKSSNSYVLRLFTVKLNVWKIVICVEIGISADVRVLKVNAGHRIAQEIGVQSIARMQYKGHAKAMISTLLNDPTFHVVRGRFTFTFTFTWHFSVV